MFKRIFATVTILTIMVFTSWAKVGVSITSNKVLDAGAGGPTTKTQAFAVKNIGDEPASVQISATNTQNWTLSSIVSTDTFSLSFSTYSGAANWMPITKNSTMINGALSGGAVQNINMQFKSPTMLSNNSLTVVQYSTITISVAPPLLPPTTNYSLIRNWGVAGSGNGQFNGLYVLACDRTNNVVYTLESGAIGSNTRIQEFDLYGNFIKS